MGRFQNNPSIGWVHPKSTHAWPLAWGNKKKQLNFHPCFTQAPQTMDMYQDPALSLSLSLSHTHTHTHTTQQQVSWWTVRGSASMWFVHVELYIQSIHALVIGFTHTEVCVKLGNTHVVFNPARVNQQHPKVHHAGWKGNTFFPEYSWPIANPWCG
jgi:hypothetical protein